MSTDGWLITATVALLALVGAWRAIRWYGRKLSESMDARDRWISESQR